MQVKGTFAKTLLGSILAATWLCAGIVHGDEDPHAKHRAMMQKPKPAEAASVSVSLREQVLVNQDGESVNFPADVIGDHIVVMDFIYTTCTTVCPVLSTIQSQVQKQLGDRLGREVLLVSTSVDPTRDTPERLKAWSQRYRSQPGWTFLTGEKSAVDKVLQGLGAYTPNFEDHPSMFLVGDGRTGQWKRFFGFPGPAQVLAAVDEFSEARRLSAAAE